MSTTAVVQQASQRTVQSSFDICHNHFTDNKATYEKRQASLSALNGHLSREYTVLTNKNAKFSGEDLKELQTKLTDYTQMHTEVNEAFVAMNNLSKCLTTTIAYLERTAQFSGLTGIQGLLPSVHESLAKDREVSKQQAQILGEDLKTLNVFIKQMSLELPTASTNLEWFKNTVGNDGLPKTVMNKIVGTYTGFVSYFSSGSQTTTNAKAPEGDATNTSTTVVSGVVVTQISDEQTSTTDNSTEDGKVLDVKEKTA